MSRLGYSFNSLENNNLANFSVTEINSLAVLLAVDGLVSKQKMEKPFDFKKARLVRSQSSDGWYVLFYVWDVQKGSLVRKRKFIPPDITSQEGKEAYAKDIIKKINDILKEGYHIDRTRKPDDASDVIQTPTLSLVQILPRYINYCQNIAKNTQKELSLKLGEIKKFMSWATDNGHESLWPPRCFYPNGSTIFRFFGGSKWRCS